MCYFCTFAAFIVEFMQQQPGTRKNRFLSFPKDNNGIYNSAFIFEIMFDVEHPFLNGTITTFPP